jgi:putative ABC transport system ATP-binding protein
MADLVTARSLCKTYHPGRLNVEALRGIDLDISAGSFVVFLGPSGSGKSTLLNLVGGISRPSQGTLQVCGVDVSQVGQADLARLRREHVGYVFQFFNLLPSQDALENTALPLLARGISWSEARRQARSTLEQLGLGERLAHRPSELSGGEQQRVAIARAVVGRPELLLADEPTGNLDSENTRQIMSLLIELHRELGLTCILATHNPAFCEIASQVIELVDGAIRSQR